MKKLFCILAVIVFATSCKKENCTIDKGIVIALQHYDYPQETTLVVIRGFCNDNLVVSEAYVPDSIANCISIGTYYTGIKNYCDTLP